MVLIIVHLINSFLDLNLKYGKKVLKPFGNLWFFCEFVHPEAQCGIRIRVKTQTDLRWQASWFRCSSVNVLIITGWKRSVVMLSASWVLVNKAAPHWHSGRLKQVRGFGFLWRQEPLSRINYYGQYQIFFKLLYQYNHYDENDTE